MRERVSHTTIVQKNDECADLRFLTETRLLRPEVSLNPRCLCGYGFAELMIVAA